MAKKAIKKVQKSDIPLLRVTIYFGYGLFLIVATLFIITIVPWFSSTGPSAFNEYTLLLVSGFALATLAPPLAGYLVGDRSSYARSKEIHHYNGILFGIAGFWLANTLTVVAGVTGVFGFVDSMGLYVLTGVVPIVLSVLVLVALGLAYARQQRHQVPIDAYAPFKWVLAASIIAMFVLYLIEGLVNISRGQDVWSSLAVFILPAAMIAGFVFLSSLIIGRAAGGSAQRLSKGLIAVSYGLVVMTFVGQIATRIDPNSQNVALVSLSGGLVLWLAYVLLMRHFSKRVKAVK